jgi:hypothetical protein
MNFSAILSGQLGRMKSLPSISFVCCVESGMLEGLTVRMIQSLRRWGGSFANAPVFAVTPRFGPGLARSTLHDFKRLDVRYLNQSVDTPYSWFSFNNKPLSLAMAEAAADTETIAWLDSDVLIVGEPLAFQLEEGVDFAACPSEKEMGTSGVGDTFEPLWRADCQALDIDIDSLPWVTSEPDGVRIRLYFNGGVFVYRRCTGFGQNYLNSCKQLMEARNRSTSSDFSIGFNEMSAIGLSMHKMGLKWRVLPYSHNYSINWRSHERLYREGDLRAARIVHHHDSMFPNFWDVFLSCLESAHPPVADWLAKLGPLRNDATLANKVWGKILRAYRARKWRAYVRSCRIV